MYKKTPPEKQMEPSKTNVLERYPWTWEISLNLSQSPSPQPSLLLLVPSQGHLLRIQLNNRSTAGVLENLFGWWLSHPSEKYYIVQLNQFPKF